jgi:hypothetical protein
MAGKKTDVPRPKGRRVSPFKATVEKRGVAYSTAREAALRGELPYFQFGRAWYVDEDDLDAFIEAARVNPE